MEDESKTKDQLVLELQELRLQNKRLETVQAELLETGKALSASEAQMRAILDGITTNLAFVNENLEIIWANKATGDSVGVRPEEMIGKKCHAYFADPAQPCEGCPTVRAFRSKKSEHTEMTTPDGRIWDERGDPVFDSDGRFLGVLEIAHDITARKRAEEALRASERKLAQIIEFLPDPTFVIDAEGKLVAWNRAVEELTGVKAAEVLGKGDYEYAIPFYGERRPVLVDLVNDPDELIESQYLYVKREADRLISENYQPHLKAGGMYLWSVARPLSDEDGHVIGAVESVRDITERRRTEDALRSSEQLLKSILDASPVGIGLARHRKMVWVNNAWARMFRFESESGYLGQDARIVYPSDEEYEKAGRTLHEGLETGVVTQTEAVLRRHDGSLFDAKIRMKALDPDNLEGGTIAAITDVSERKRAEKALRENERTYRSLFERSMDAILVVRPEGEIIDANSACSELLGVSREELVGSKAHRYYWNGQDREVYLQEMSQRGFVKEFPLQVRRADGEQRSCVLNSTTLRNDAGEIIAFLSVVHDVTESRRLEEQLRQAQKIEAMGTLAGGIAHDFNNLLTVIQGFAEILLYDKERGSLEYQDLQKIVQSARQGAELVQRLRTFSRNAEPRVEPLNLNRRIEEIGPFLHRALPKMIEVELMLSADLGEVNADPAQIDQVLMNLAINAMESMPNGGKLAFETSNVVIDEDFCAERPGMRPGLYVLLRVRDIGRGMDKATRERIFDPFFTTKARNTEKGTGLGLPVVLGIVHAHDGWIECATELDQGTTFAIYLPRIASRRTQTPSFYETALEGGAETILLVDDEQFVRELGERILTRAGYRVLTAENGRKALEIFTKNQTDIALVILDLIMPEMSGKECFYELRRRDPKVKVVVASGYATSEEPEEISPELARGYLKKPYEAKRFLQTVRGALDGR